MPRLTSSGRVVSGLGQVPLDDSRVIGQRQIDGRWRVCIDGVPVSDSGCTAIAAAAGQWIAYAPTVGVFGSFISSQYALKHDLAGRGAASPDGTFALCKRDGSGLYLWRAGLTSPLKIDTASTADICVVDRERVLWVNGGVKVAGLPQPKVVQGPVGWPSVLHINGQWWLCYHSTDQQGVVLHPFDSLTGYKVTAPPAFYLHAVVLNGQIRVAWATDPAEAHVVTRAFDTTQPRVRLDVSHPLPQPEPEPMPTVPNLKHVVERNRKNYATPIPPAQFPRFLAETITDMKRETGLNIGLLKKPDSNSVTMLSGIRVSRDIAAVHQGRELWTYDFLGGAEKDATPRWARTNANDGSPGVEEDTSKFYDVRPSDLGEPVPNPGPDTPDPGTPPETPTDEATILHLLGRLGRHLGAWQ